jgi:hypothetical protein
MNPMQRTYCWRRTDKWDGGPRKGKGKASNVVEVFKNINFAEYDYLRFEVWPKECPDDVMKCYAANGTPKGFAIWDSRGQLYP